MAQKKFVCSVCGYVHNGDKAPEVCPQCKQSGVFTEVKEKKGLDTNSNVYTIVYAAIIVVIVAVLLALVSQVLSPRQEANKLLDTQKQILVALNQDYSTTDPAALYLSLVNDTIDVNGAPVYVAEIEGETKYVLKLHGAGLWGGIGGFLALDADKNTIYGINFNHESETPGLGTHRSDETSLRYDPFYQTVIFLSRKNLGPPIPFAKQVHTDTRELSLSFPRSFRNREDRNNSRRTDRTSSLRNTDGMRDQKRCGR